MGSRFATELLGLPVNVREIRLGETVDVLLDLESSRVLGFVVRCRDEVERFLALAASNVRDEEVAVGSALLLLDDVGFYRVRSRSLRELLGSVTADGILTDIRVDEHGTVMGFDVGAPAVSA
jgi:hypothetical protein